MDNEKITIRLTTYGFLAYVATATDLQPNHIDIEATSSDLIGCMAVVAGDVRKTNAVYLG